MVFQDPFNALNPRLTIGQTLAEVLRVQKKIGGADIPARIGELLDLVGLEREFAHRKPRSMSGGPSARGRASARALAVDPKLIIRRRMRRSTRCHDPGEIVDLFPQARPRP